VLFGSAGLAAVVPAVLIMTSNLSWPRRIGLTVAMLFLLALDCGFTFYIAALSEVAEVGIGWHAARILRLRTNFSHL